MVLSGGKKTYKIKEVRFLGHSDKENSCIWANIQTYTGSKKILLALSGNDFSFPTVSTAPVKRLNSVAEHLELEYDESSFSSKTELTRRQNMLKVAATSLGSQAKSHFFDLLYSYIAL